MSRVAYSWIGLLLALVLWNGARPACAEVQGHGEPSSSAIADEVGQEVEAAEHEAPNILEFKPSLALATALVFGLLLLVLGRYAWKPLAKALDDRERAQEEAVERVELARAESERLLAEHRQLMAEASDKARAMQDQIRQSAEASAAGILAQAQKDVEATKVRAERDITQARDQALGEIWTRTADLAVSVAGKVLSRELGPEEHRRMVGTAMHELSAIGEGESDSRGRGGPA